MISIEVVEHSITSATDRILKTGEPGGLLRDFRTEAGLSDEWVSAFVVHALSQAGSIGDHTSGIVETLVSRQRKNGGWSYNGDIPADCDSTGWVLMSLANVPGRKPSVVSRAVRFIRLHQDQETGGFCTYSGRDAIDQVIGVPRQADVDDWLEAQPCVTGLALLSLLIQGEPLSSRTVQRAADFLMEQRCASGLWQAYWWKGYAYSTYLCLRALWAAHRLTKEMALLTLSHVLAEQRSDGGWNDEGGEESEVFATSFCLLCLMLFPQGSIADSVVRAVSWLVAKQRKDGRWPSAAILRVPSPMASRPEGMTDQSWRIMQRGTGITVLDSQSIYTSSAAVWALGVFCRIYANS